MRKAKKERNCCVFYNLPKLILPFLRNNKNNIQATGGRNIEIDTTKIILF